MLLSYYNPVTFIHSFISSFTRHLLNVCRSCDKNIKMNRKDLCPWRNHILQGKDKWINNKLKKCYSCYFKSLCMHKRCSEESIFKHLKVSQVLYKRVYTIWVHLYEVLEQANLIYEKIRTVVAFEWGGWHFPWLGVGLYSYMYFSKLIEWYTRFVHFIACRFT